MKEEPSHAAHNNQQQTPGPPVCIRKQHPQTTSANTACTKQTACVSDALQISRNVTIHCQPTTPDQKSHHAVSISSEIWLRSSTRKCVGLVWIIRQHLEHFLDLPDQIAWLLGQEITTISYLREKLLMPWLHCGMRRVQALLTCDRGSIGYASHQILQEGS